LQLTAATAVLNVALAMFCWKLFAAHLGWSQLALLLFENIIVGAFTPLLSLVVYHP